MKALLLILASRRLDKTTSTESLYGGVSLGAYESGFTYYMTNIVDNDNQDIKPNIFTGASAGGINSLLGAIEACKLKPKLPKESLFWNVWIPIGIESLVNERKMTSINLFSREAFKPVALQASKTWKGGLKKDCSIVFGISLTRLIPEYIQLDKHLKVPKMTEYVILKLTGNGPNILPKIENFL